MIVLTEHEAGVVLSVKAQPGAKRNAVTGVRAGSLLVSVTQVAEKGKANRAVRSVIAKDLGFRKSQVAIVSGQTSAQKKFLISNTTAHELLDRIRQHLGDVI